jgi:hypothetical protein
MIKAVRGPNGVPFTRICCPLPYRGIATYFCRKFNYLQTCHQLITIIRPRTEAVENLLDATERNIWFHSEIMASWFRSIELIYYNDTSAVDKLPERNMEHHRSQEMEAWIRQEHFIHSHHPAKVLKKRHLMKMNVDVFKIRN